MARDQAPEPANVAPADSSNGGRVSPTRWWRSELAWEEGVFSAVRDFRVVGTAKWPRRAGGMQPDRGATSAAHPIASHGGTAVPWLHRLARCGWPQSRWVIRNAPVNEAADSRLTYRTRGLSPASGGATWLADRVQDTADLRQPDSTTAGEARQARPPPPPPKPALTATTTSGQTPHPPSPPLQRRFDPHHNAPQRDPRVAGHDSGARCATAQATGPQAQRPHDPGQDHCERHHGADHETQRPA